MAPIDDLARAQIDALRLDRARPLVVCDVDEVVLQFLAGLERHLDANGCWLDRASYALNGNVRRHEDGAPIPLDEFSNLLAEFLEAYSEHLDPIDGAVDGLAALEPHAEIVLLTNLPHQYAPARVRNLGRHGVSYPLIANTGPKGPAMDYLLGEATTPAIFLDDSPKNLESVIAARPETTAIHFIADPGFARIAPAVEGIALKTSTWPDAVAFIESRLSAA